MRVFISSGKGAGEVFGVACPAWPYKMKQNSHRKKHMGVVL